MPAYLLHPPNRRPSPFHPFPAITAKLEPMAAPNPPTAIREVLPQCGRSFVFRKWAKARTSLTRPNRADIAFESGGAIFGIAGHAPARAYLTADFSPRGAAPSVRNKGARITASEGWPTP